MPSMVKLAAFTVTVPALPELEVLELIVPPFWISRVAAFTVTVPALPAPPVSEVILPRPNTEACPVTATSTAPALPVDPTFA